ncbi:MAG: response regulator [Cyanothece sp. SIO2G6]|nr:response regulator [Cyanothece sp. SIO2G6]
MTVSYHSPTPPKSKILVVDDEPDNLDLLYRTFRREFKVLKAESGPEALRLLEQQDDIAVIISDQRMPSMSGTEFLSLTATQYPDIIRIILTGYTDVEDLVEAINAGQVFKYVTKPWDEEELRGVVQQAVDTHNVLRTRTYELRSNLRRETLLNTINRTIQGALNSEEILQTLVDTIGQIFEVDCCVLCPFQADTTESAVFFYVSGDVDSFLNEERRLALMNTRTLAKTVWQTKDVQAIDDSPGNLCAIEADETGLAETGCIPPSAWSSYQSLGIQSTLLVPFMYQSDLLAVLALHQLRSPQIWQDDDIQLIAMVANQAALILSQARTYERVRALAKRQALINTITSAIRSSLDPDDIFAAITQRLGEALQVDGCVLSLWTSEDVYVKCVGLYEAHGDEALSLELEDGATMTHEHLPTSQAPIRGNPVLTELMQTKRPVIVGDLAERPDLNSFELPLRSPARSLLIVPLLSEGDIIGSITLRQVNQPRKWQSEAIDLAQAVAEQAAIAVQQANLYQTTRQQAEKLLELDRQKTEFFQNISHEFRTPLTLNIGPLETCVEQQQGLSYEQSVIALRNARRLLRLVNQLLDIQRLDAGRMQPTFAPCRIKAFIEQVVESFQPYCQKKGITLLVKLMDTPQLYLDGEKFDKVLYNLLSNAMKFTPEGGSIQVSLEAEGDRCILEVKDTGIGIRDDQIASLFDRFQQADGSDNREYEGSGLGLALVKELVELHGGEVNVASTYGEGTTFQVTLLYGAAHLPPDRVSEVPVEIEQTQSFVELADINANVNADVSVEDDESEVVAASVDSSDVPGTEMAIATAPRTSELSTPPTEASHILVVDDNPDLRSYVSLILKQAGYQVSTARHGREGLELIQLRQPHLILTDLMMPHISGLELIQQVRQTETIKGVPIILVTAKADEDTRIEGVEQGADAYLSKPFNHRELLAEVRNLLALKAREQQVAQLNAYLTESVLKRFLPPALVQRAAQGELSLNLMPEPRLVTVLFSDIVGFTQISNTLRSRRVASLLNEYLAEMTHAVFENGGTVDKFMGDAVLAIFGAPEDMSPNEQVKRAIASARQMLMSLERLNVKWREQGIPPIQFRCGIHQGTAVVGMFGSEERSDYTAIGPSVNIASRIQEVAHPGGILVSATVADYLDDTEISKFQPLALKGIDETVLTFELNPTAPKE